MAKIKDDDAVQSVQTPVKTVPAATAAKTVVNKVTTNTGGGGGGGGSGSSSSGPNWGDIAGGRPLTQALKDWYTSHGNSLNGYDAYVMGTGGNNQASGTASDQQALAAIITATQGQTLAQSAAYGYMVKPILSATGNITGYEPVLDAQGNKIPTLQAGSSAAQVSLWNAQAAQAAADTVLAHAKAYGKVKEPETGAWTATSEKLLSDTQQQLNIAQAQRLGAQTQMEQQNYLAQALADPNRFVEAFGLAQLQGTRAGGTGGQPGGLWGYAQNFQAGVPSGQAMGGQGVSTQSAPAATAMGVPGAVASGAGAAQGGSIGTRSVGANGQPLIALGQGPLPPGTAQTTNQLTNLAQNTQVPMSGNLNAAVGGQYVPTIGNASGSQGAVTTLANVSPASGNFAKISPVVFRNLDTATQGQYGSLAQSIQGINAADLKQKVNAQLPGSSGGIPSAFRL